jgi:hypothetical protein
MHDTSNDECDNRSNSKPLAKLPQDGIGKDTILDVLAKPKGFQGSGRRNRACTGQDVAEGHKLVREDRCV